MNSGCQEVIANLSLSTRVGELETNAIIYGNFLHPFPNLHNSAKFIIWGRPSQHSSSRFFLPAPNLIFPKRFIIMGEV